MISFQVISFELAFMRNCLETIWRVSFKQPRQYSYSLHTLLAIHIFTAIYIFIGDIYIYWRYIYLGVTVLTQLLFPCIYHTNQRSHKKTRKNANLRKVSAWKFNMLDRNHVSSTTTKLRFYCFVPNIWMAGFENVAIYCFRSVIWLVFIFWVAPVSVNAL